MCCLSECNHLGHKELAAKLKDAMDNYKCNFKDELVCSVYVPSKKPSANQQQDLFDEMFDFIGANYPAEKWEGLANALSLVNMTLRESVIQLLIRLNMLPWYYSDGK